MQVRSAPSVLCWEWTKWQKCHQEGCGRMRLNQKVFLNMEKGARRVCTFWLWDPNLRNSVLWSELQYSVSGGESPMHQAHRCCLRCVWVYNLPWDRALSYTWWAEPVTWDPCSWKPRLTQKLAFTIEQEEWSLWWECSVKSYCENLGWLSQQ